MCSVRILMAGFFVILKTSTKLMLQLVKCLGGPSSTSEKILEYFKLGSQNNDAGTSVALRAPG